MYYSNIAKGGNSTVCRPLDLKNVSATMHLVYFKTFLQSIYLFSLLEQMCVT